MLGKSISRRSQVFVSFGGVTGYQHKLLLPAVRGFLGGFAEELEVLLVLRSRVGCGAGYFAKFTGLQN